MINLTYIHFTDEQKQRAASVDLEAFLLSRGERLISSGRDKRLASDHSITIRGNEWYDHAEEKGGTAISFVQRHYGIGYAEAVSTLLGDELGVAYPQRAEKCAEVKPFALPPANKNMHRVYTITELKTDGAYTLLKNGIGLVISVGESSTVCDVYSSDVLGLIQNDPRYADVEEGLFHNMPQKHLDHKLLTASAKVDNKQVSLGSDNGSANAFVPLTVVNTKGFDLPKTGGYGNWMFPAIGLSLVAVAVVVIYFAFRDKKKETNK